MNENAGDKVVPVHTEKLTYTDQNALQDVMHIILRKASREVEVSHGTESRPLPNPFFLFHNLACLSKSFQRLDPTPRTFVGHDRLSDSACSH